MPVERDANNPDSEVVRPSNEADVSLDEMLSLACRQGKQEIAELLLDSGALVSRRNKSGNTPLLEACSQGYVQMAALLLDRGADIDAATETTHDSALTWACTLGNESVVRLLLERNANVEHRTKDGCTALMFAALAGHVKVKTCGMSLRLMNRILEHLPKTPTTPCRVKIDHIYIRLHGFESAR
jgi:ankyrin repeat domain-containing protein 17